MTDDSSGRRPKKVFRIQTPNSKLSLVVSCEGRAAGRRSQSVWDNEYHSGFKDHSLNHKMREEKGCQTVCTICSTKQALLVVAGCHVANMSPMLSKSDSGGSVPFL